MAESAAGVLRRARALAGLSQRELADRAGVSQPVISAYERGRRVRLHRETIVATAARRGVRNVRLFGSVARGDDRETNDVDLLVDLDDGVSLLDLIGLERELTELLGCGVDVVPARNVKPGVARHVLAEATPL